MKMKALIELLKDYSDDADVCVVEVNPTTFVKSYYRIKGLDVLDWGASFELVVGRKS